jgi:competence protein ComEA
LLVDVEGTVRRPGVVTVPAGSRVRDVLAAAGGVAPGAPTVSVNLAEPVSDGEQVVVGGSGATTPGAGRGTGGSAGPVDLNTATEADLERLPGIGPVLAARVLDFRRTHGRFSSVEELREVSGIGPAKFSALRSRVRV